MIRPALVILTISLLAACSSQPKQSIPKPTIKTIAIIPATLTSEFALVNESALQFLIPLAATANYLDSKEKTKTFDARIRAQKFDPATTLTQSVASALQTLGYSVSILTNVERTKDSPDSIVYEKVSSTSDAILHIAYSTIGFYSPRSSSDYLPRVNAYGIVYVKGREDYLYDSYVYYGADAKIGQPWAIGSEPSFRYQNFESIISNIPEIQIRLDRAAQQIGKRIALQVHDAIKIK